jgi:hypothetical protein
LSLGSSVLHAHTTPSQPTGNMDTSDAEGNAIRKMRIGTMLEWMNLVVS